VLRSIKKGAIPPSKYTFRACTKTLPLPVNMIKHLLSLYKVGPTNIDRMSQEFRSHLFDIWFALVYNLEDHVTALTWLLKHLHFALL
jgi:hypothetical protein